MKYLLPSLRVSALLFVLCASSAGAQTIPSEARPRNVEDLLRTRPSAKSRPATTEVPREDPVPGSTYVGQTFLVSRVRFSGTTVFSEEVLRSEVAFLENKEVTLDAANHAADRITRLYRNAGYILSKAVVPPQELQNGLLTIQVTEGRMGRIGAEGARIPLRLPIKDAATPMPQRRPFNLKDLERTLLELNDLPGLNVRAIIQASTIEGAAADLILMAGKDPVNTQLVLDNMGSSSTGPWRAFGTISFNGWLGGRERTTVIFGGALPSVSELQSLGLRHEHYVGPRQKLILSASRSGGAPGAGLQDLEIRTVSQSFGLSGEAAEFYKRGHTIRLNGGIEWQSSKVQLLGEQISKDRLLLAQGRVSWDFFDRWSGANSFSIEAEKGLGGRKAEDISRAGASGTGVSIGAEFARHQPLPGSRAMVVALQTRWSPNPQLALQEIDFGGAAFGRGYSAGSIAGEVAGAISLELRQALRCPIASEQGGCEPFVFAEGASVLDRDPAGNSRSSIASVGGGVRIQLGPILAEGGLAVPLKRIGAQEQHLIPFLRLLTAL